MNTIQFTPDKKILLSGFTGMGMGSTPAIVRVK